MPTSRTTLARTPIVTVAAAAALTIAGAIPSAALPDETATLTAGIGKVVDSTEAPSEPPLPNPLVQCITAAEDASLVLWACVGGTLAYVPSITETPTGAEWAAAPDPSVWVTEVIATEGATYIGNYRSSLIYGNRITTSGTFFSTITGTFDADGPAPVMAFPTLKAMSFSCPTSGNCKF